MPDNLIIVSNESIFSDGESFYCDNIDMKSIPEGLSSKFNVYLLGRKSKTKKFHKIGIRNIFNSSNIFTHLLNIFKIISRPKKESNVEYRYSRLQQNWRARPPTVEPKSQISDLGTGTSDTRNITDRLCNARN